VSVASADLRRRVARRLTLEQVLAATPLLAIVASLAVLYAGEAVAHPTPTLFVDELQWTQLSRSVADHGYASIRGERASFQSLYVYLIAPAWRLTDTASAYELVKYLNILFMLSAAFPAYFLSRRLVSKPAALAVAAASVAIAPMAYVLYVITEPVAYPWAVLCAWLIVEALSLRTRGWIVSAVAASLMAPFVRSQLVVVPAAFALAALLVWWRSPRARRLRGVAWTRGDTVGLVLLGVGAFAVVTRLLLHSNTQWQIATDNAARIWLHAVWAAAALTIGLGVLPVVAGLAALVPRRSERLLPHDRAFIAVTVALAALLAAYTGLKGAYNEVTFANRIDERNLFYVAPLLFLAAAIALERRRVRIVPLLAAAGFALYLIRATELQLNYPYFDAPGFSIATMTNRQLYWPPETIHRALYVTFGISVAIALAARFGRGRWTRTGLVVVSLLVIAWNLAGQVTAAGGANAGARTFERNLPHPVDWVDRATGGETVTYLGQSITTGVGLRTNLLEFWNPAIIKVGTLDGSELFPGPTLLPRVVKADGTLSEQPGTPYVLADAGIFPVGAQVAHRGVLRLYRVDGPIRFRESVEGVDEEAWMGSSAAYNRFALAGGGQLVVTLSRTAFCPDPSVAPPAPRVSVTVGPLGIGRRNGLEQPVLGGGPWTARTRVVPNCERRELRLPVEGAPFRAEVHVDRTFKPSDFGFPDTRTLGVMIAFRVEGDGES
jgi:hypothetical protein